MTDDAAFRVVAVSTTATVQEVLARQKPLGNTRKTLGDLVTGSILIRETMAPSHRVQAIIKRSEGPGSLLADSHPTSGTRGLVSLPEGQPALPLEGAMLQVMRSLHDGRVHQGVVSIPDHSSVSAGLKSYMQVSEQVDSFVAMETHLENDNVVSASGYLVQLLPGVGTAPMAFMEERIAEFGSLSSFLRETGSEPKALVAKLLEGIEHTALGENELCFGCWCSAERLLGALATLPRSDIEEFVECGEVLEISCEYCHKDYQIPPAKLRGLLQES